MSQISMMKFQSFKRGLRFYLLAGLLLTTTASTTWADETRSTISLRYHTGQIDDSSWTATHIAASYLFNMTPSFSLGFGYLGGENTWSILLFDDSPDYQALMLVAEARLRLSERNNLYARLSGLNYEHDISFDETTSAGIGIGAAFGWSMRFNSGIGLEIGYEYLRLDSDIEPQTLSFGISYSF